MTFEVTGYLSDADIHAVCGEGCLYPRCALTCQGRRETGEWVQSIYRTQADAERLRLAEEYGPPNPARGWA